MPNHHYYTYILSSTSKHLYIGITNNLERRIQEHKSKTNPTAFTAKYNITQLVYFERFTHVQEAIARETEIKKWNRLKKIKLIVASNPTWKDLSQDFGTPIPPFQERDQRPPTTF